jgi:hypothetical protein
MGAIKSDRARKVSIIDSHAKLLVTSVWAGVNGVDRAKANDAIENDVGKLFDGFLPVVFFIWVARSNAADLVAPIPGKTSDVLKPAKTTNHGVVDQCHFARGKDVILEVAHRVLLSLWFLKSRARLWHGLSEAS